MITCGHVILEQLGGNRFRAMTGARDFVWDGVAQRLTFRLPWPTINMVRVTLNAKDLYDVEFCHYRALKLTVKARATDVYAEDLQRIFTANTGLDTHL